MRARRSIQWIAGALMALSFATQAHGSVNICWQLLEPIWVPPTPHDAVECAAHNGPLCFFMPHCCFPTCRLHPECVLGGTFVAGHWDTLDCRLMEPEVALEQFARGFLRPADDFLEPIRQAAVIHIHGLMAFGQPIPSHVQRLINDLMRSNFFAGQPQFQPGHAARALLLPERQPSADIYLPNPDTGAITLDRLIIMRNGSFDAIYNEPPRTADDLLCGRASERFKKAISLLMHELVHVRQWDVLGYDSFLNNYLLEVIVRSYGSDSFESEAFQLSRFVNEQLVAPARNESHAWVFSNVANFSGTRIPSTGNINSAGGTNTVARDRAGSYTLNFGSLSGLAGGNVQVTAGATNRYCKPLAWGPLGADLLVDVRCFDNSGAPADSPFFATAQKIDRLCDGMGYFLTDRTTGTFEPAARSSYSQSLAPNRVVRGAPGLYTAIMPGFSGTGGNAQVSAVGSDSTRCQTAGWFLSAGGLALVNVSCFRPDGTPADTLFSLQFSSYDFIGQFPALENVGAYLWANQPGASSTYTPSDAHRYSNREGLLVFEAPTIQRLSAGRYRAYLPGYSEEIGMGALQVTPYGSAPRICSIVSRGASSTRARVDIACTDTAGRVSDSMWTLMFGSNVPLPI